jgi:exosortase/archaeosortase family protein
MRNNLSRVKTKLIEYYRNNKTIIHFIFRVAIIYFAWKLILFVLGEEKIPIDERMWPWLSQHWENFNDFVRIILLHSTKFYFDLVGLHSEILTNNRLWVHGYVILGVGNYCLAIQLWLFFAALIFSYPGKFMNKVWYTIVGILSINVLNVLRLIAVCYAAHYYPEYIQFNHDYVFNVIIYIFTFIMWIVWINRFSKT